MVPKKYIPVFIDAKPAENLDPSKGQTLCFVGMISSNMSGVAKLKAYKDTKRQIKLDSAQAIIDHLSDRKLEVDLIGLAGKSNGQYIHWACDTINRAHDLIRAEWEVEGSVPTHLLWNGHRMSRSTVLGLSLYSAMLPIIGLRAEALAEGDSCKNFKLILDALPHNSSVGMELMNSLRREPDLNQMWQQNLARGASFEVVNLGRWKDDRNRWRLDKKHPNSILVDWFAVSCLANTDPGQLQKEGSYSDLEVERLAQIWKAGFRPGASPILNLDDNDLKNRILNKDDHH